jgi:hypothetical protein
MDCPLCSSSIKLRTARRGRNTGSQFWGCSRYPACRGTRQANDEVARRPSRYFVSPFRHLTRRIVSRYEVRKIGGLCWLYFAASTVRGTPSRLSSNDALHGSVDGRNAPSRLPDSLSIDIVDGDTIRSGGVVYRLVGFNTPESGLNAGCEKERMLAAKATQRLRQLLGGWKSSA